MTESPRIPSESAVVRLIEAELAPDFTLLRPLGEGDRSHVFLARDVQLERLVAIKVMAGALAEDHSAKLRFVRAARAAASLTHPHIVPLYRFGFLPTGLPYVVMGHVDGVTLEEKVAAEGVPEIAMGRRILGDIADALATAHASGFVHRNLRPENVLFESRSGKVVVVGFGLVGSIPGAREASARITAAGEILGEAPYASPEQLRGGQVTEAADAYSLGVLGFELLTGVPFASATPTGAREGKASDRPAQRALRAAHPATADLLDRCLSPDPRKRPTATYLRRTFREPLVTESATPPPASLAAPAVGQSARKRQSGGLLGVLGGRVQRPSGDEPLGTRRRLAAVWFADIVGYVRASSEDERRAMSLVTVLQRTARRVVGESGGTIVKFLGDEVLAEFSSTELALRSAHRMMREFESEARKLGLEAELRVGVHVGDVAEDSEGDIYGDGVNLAARLVSEAAPGSIWVSEDVWRQLRRRPDLPFETVGQRVIKGLDEPVQIYESLPLPSPPADVGSHPLPGRWGDRTGNPAFAWYIAAVLLGLLLLLFTLLSS